MTPVNVDNIRSQMRKGMLEYCVMLMLDVRPAFASEIIDRMRSVHLIVVEGTLYPLLTRLKNAGLLTYRWQESTLGPPRKYYALTDDGRGFLHLLREAWQEMANAVEVLSRHAVATECSDAEDCGIHKNNN